MEIGICGAGVEGSTDGCVSRVDWLGVWPVSKCDWLSAPPLVGGRSGEATGGLREPVVEFSGWGPGSQGEDLGWPSAREGTEG